MAAQDGLLHSSSTEGLSAADTVKPLGSMLLQFTHIVNLLTWKFVAS